MRNLKDGVDMATVSTGVREATGSLLILGTLVHGNLHVRVHAVSSAMLILIRLQSRTQLLHIAKSHKSLERWYYWEQRSSWRYIIFPGFWTVILI